MLVCLPCVGEGFSQPFPLKYLLDRPDEFLDWCVLRMACPLEFCRFLVEWWGWVTRSDHSQCRIRLRPHWLWTDCGHLVLLENLALLSAWWCPWLENFQGFYRLIGCCWPSSRSWGVWMLWLALICHVNLLTSKATSIIELDFIILMRYWTQVYNWIGMRCWVCDRYFTVIVWFVWPLFDR